MTAAVEHWGIVANVHGDRRIRHGAKVWVLFLPGDPTHVWVYGMSLGGRMITKWTRSRFLSNIRPKFCAETFRGHYWGDFDSKEEAIKLAADFAARVEWVKAEWAASKSNETWFNRVMAL